MTRILHTSFTAIKIHTAKCDLCNQRNKHVLQRCDACGWSICGPCFLERGDDGSHLINEGDNGWTVERAHEITREETPAVREKTAKKRRGKETTRPGKMVRNAVANLSDRREGEGVVEERSSRDLETVQAQESEPPARLMNGNDSPKPHMAGDEQSQRDRAAVSQDHHISLLFEAAGVDLASTPSVSGEPHTARATVVSAPSQTEVAPRLRQLYVRSITYRDARGHKKRIQ